MSTENQGQNQTEATEQQEVKAPEAAQQPAQNRQQRREEQRKQKNQQKQAKASDKPQAPAGIFGGKSKDVGDAQPERVKLIKANIDEYAANAGNNQTNMDEAMKAYNVLFNGFRLILLLKANSDVRDVLNHLSAKIKADTTRAFGKEYLFRYVHEYGSDTDQLNFVRLMNMATKFAALEDKSKLKNHVDVEFSVSKISKKDVAKMIAQFYKR